MRHLRGVESAVLSSSAVRLEDVVLERERALDDDDCVRDVVEGGDR